MWLCWYCAPSLCWRWLCGPFQYTLQNSSLTHLREAEICGCIGTETDRRAAVLKERLGIDPLIEWSDSGRIQLNQEVTVTLTLRTDIGLFGGFASFPVTLRAQATGKSEVYWK